MIGDGDVLTLDGDVLACYSEI